MPVKVRQIGLTTVNGIPGGCAKVVLSEKLSGDGSGSQIVKPVRRLDGQTGIRVDSKCENSTAASPVGHLGQDEDAVIAFGPFNKTPTEILPSLCQLRRWLLTTHGPFNQFLEFGQIFSLRLRKRSRLQLTLSGFV